jgi:MFS family permease
MLEDLEPPVDRSGHKRHPRVAVIGVHGIAHHDPGATANAMADLLLSMPPYDPAEPISTSPKYFTEFRSIGIQVPLRPISIEQEKRVDTKDDSRLHRLARSFQEESAEFSRALVQESRTQSDLEPLEHVDEPGENVDLKFSRRLLQDYQGGANGNAYITTRLEGRRNHDPRRPDANVHIYEMFWADLARPTNSVVSFFLAIFQLVLHLPSLSRLAVDTYGATKKRWKAYQFAQRYAARILQILLPMLKIVLVVALFAAAPAVATGHDLTVVAAAMAGISGTAICFLLANLLHKPVYRERVVWLVASFFPDLLLGVGTYFLIRQNYWKQEVVLAFVIWLLGSLLLWYAIRAYQSIRPGIAWAGGSVYILTFLVFWRWVAQGTSIDRVSLWTTQWLLVLLRFSWLAFTLFAIAAFLLGAVAWRTEKTEANRAKARAAVRTSRLALALPTFLFVFITGMIWAGFFSAANAIKGNANAQEGYFNQNLVKGDVAPGSEPLDNIKRFDLFPHREIGENVGLCDRAREAHSDYLKGVLAWSLGYGTWIVGLLALVGLLVMVWWVLPAVLTEKFPPRKPQFSRQKNQSESPRRSTNSESVWLGAWISRGLDSTSFVTYWIWLAVFLVPCAFLFTGSRRVLSENIMKWVVCEAITVAASAALLASVIRYSSPVIRCILDVDTYLRTGPTNATPRAQIFERFASLLRYIAQYRDADGQGYDSVVIVAHSLGSLISADLLRLLNELKSDRELSPLGLGPDPPPPKPIPIRLFTMGNPLRQLLNRFFPYLYAWVREEPDNALKELSGPVAEEPDETGTEAPPDRKEPSEPAAGEPAKTNPEVLQDPKAPPDAKQLPEPAAVEPDKISPDALPDPKKLGVTRWVNAYRSGDYVGRSLWTNEWYQRTTTGTGLYPEEVHVVCEPDSAPGEARPPDPRHLRGSQDTTATSPSVPPKMNKTRFEFCIGSGAHTHYWDDTAPDIARCLNNLLTEPVDLEPVKTKNRSVRSESDGPSVSAASRSTNPN